MTTKVVPPDVISDEELSLWFEGEIELPCEAKPRDNSAAEWLITIVKSCACVPTTTYAVCGRHKDRFAPGPLECLVCGGVDRITLTERLK